MLTQGKDDKQKDAKYAEKKTLSAPVNTIKTRSHMHGQNIGSAGRMHGKRAASLSERFPQCLFGKKGV